MPSFAVAILALGFLTVAADATAIASVKDAFWQADFAWYDNGRTQTSALPDGVVLTCTGTATSDGAGGCRDSASATVISSSGVLEMTTVDRVGGLSLRYDGTAAPSGVFAFIARFASFYPAPPGSGASVDDGADESADYFAVVDGTGGFDLHGCNMTGAPGHSGRHECRPSASGFQESLFTLGPATDWTELNANWQIYIQVSAIGDPVPEAPALALFVSGVAFTACRRKDRSSFRQIRRLSWWKARSHPRP